MSDLKSSNPRLRSSAYTILVVALVAGGCKTGSSANPQPASASSPRGLCRGLDVDADARELHEKLIRIATSSDSASVRTRATVGLPVMPADSVVLVNDPAICERASAQISRIRGVPAPGYEKVSVFRLGSIYVANRPDGHAGLDAFVMDATLKIRMGWML